MKRFGLIGAGGYAGTYVINLLDRHAKKEILFCGVVVRPQDRAQVADNLALLTEAGIPVFPDKDALYADAKPDVVCLPVAIGAHCPLAVDAVEKGINVMVEKPAAGSVEEVDRMAEAEKRTGKFITVGFQHIHAPDIRDLKVRLISGQFGAVRKIAVLGLWPRGDGYYRRNDWVCRLRGSHGEPVYDSPVNNAFAHYLNLALFLSSKEKESSDHAIAMKAELFRARRGIETFDTCGIRMKTRTETEILTLFSHACAEGINPILRIQCGKGVVEWTEASSWKFTPFSGGEPITGGPASDGRKAMFDLLIRKAEGEDVFACPLSIAREHTFCIEAMHRHFTVSEIPEAQIAVNPETGCREVQGLTAAFRRCFENSQLPSESGIAWTERTGTVTGMVSCTKAGTDIRLFP